MFQVKKIFIMIAATLLLTAQSVFAEGQLVSTTPTIVQKGSITIAGNTASYKMNDSYTEIFKQWNSNINSLKGLSNQKQTGYYTGITQVKSWTKYDYIAGVEVSSAEQLPANMTATVVPATKYAKFTYKGDLKTYEKVSGDILDKYIKEAKLKWDQKKPIIEEFKTAQFTPANLTSTNNIVEVYVPLQ